VPDNQVHVLADVLVVPVAWGVLDPEHPHDLSHPAAITTTHIAQPTAGPGGRRKHWVNAKHILGHALVRHTSILIAAAAAAAARHSSTVTQYPGRTADSGNREGAAVPWPQGVCSRAPEPFVAVSSSPLVLLPHLQMPLPAAL